MNLIEFPMGPITKTSSNTLEVSHPVWDKKERREVNRSLLITGSDAFGLPRPIDDQVLVGLQALTQEAGYKSPKVFFSQYRLCQILGWKPDGRAYARIESSFDRLAATTLKFKNSWWDNREKTWRSHWFHIIDNAELCTAERYSKFVAGSGQKHQSLNYFIWNEVVWKSFQDSYIKRVDMEMFRRIARGRRREVALRLYRWLDKRFWRNHAATIDVRKLGEGTLGVAGKYPSEFARTIEKAAKVLIDCEFLDSYSFGSRKNGVWVTFVKRRTAKKKGTDRRVIFAENASKQVESSKEAKKEMQWLTNLSEEELFRAETEALESGFGSSLERNHVWAERKKTIPIKLAGEIRRHYIRRVVDQEYRRDVAKFVTAA